MKKIFKDSRVQTLISILIMFASYLVSTIQGIFGIFFPFILLTFFVLMIVLVYYIAIVPVIKILKPEISNSKRVYSMENIKEYEMTKSITEIWVITSNLELAYDRKEFGDVIITNIKRGVGYKFFVCDNNIARERASAMAEYYSKYKGLFEVYFISEDLPFVDHNTDYDLFFYSNNFDNKGFIGITIENEREYVAMSQDMFIKLKLFIDKLDLECWNN